MAISKEINATRPLLALGTLGQLLGRTEIAHRQIGVQFFSWVQRNFESSGGLRTTPWVPLAPSTVKAKARGGWSPKPLYRTGNLRQSFAPFSDATQAGIGAKASFGVDYAKVHEEGSSHVPARPMLPPEDVALGIVTRVYNRFILDARDKAAL